MSIEQLGQLRVTSVSRRPENLNQTPASIYVITAEDIRRSGVTTIPQALRLAPGVEVARNGSNEWTISIRGFSSDLSNKLLVLIDGRSVYSPLFAGVFWDVQDTLLADIERIEVVSGPGGAVWGANAVNGVINIITQAARDTQGGFAELGFGNEEEGFAAFRYGWKPSEKLAARAYVKTFERDEAELISTGRPGARWMGNVARGLRAHLGTHGAGSRERARGPLRRRGRRAAARRFHARDAAGPRRSGSRATVGPQRARDLAPRVSAGRELAHPVLLRPDGPPDPRQLQRGARHVRLRVPARSRRLAGGTMRNGARKLRSTSDDIGNTQFSSFFPASRTDQTLSAFVQDRIELKDERVYLTLGAKLEHNDYTGFEQQPNIRVTWLPGEGQTVWGAVSRAVRVPARLNTDVVLFAPVALPGLPPLYINVNGNPNFLSEELDAYEAGYRCR